MTPEQKAYSAGYEAAREQAVDVCREQMVVFGSPQFRTGQPLSSISERFACSECAGAIATMTPEKADD